MVLWAGDYGVPDCILQSEGQYMSIEMYTDSFIQAPGFRATHIAIDGTGLDSKYATTSMLF